MTRSTMLRFAAMALVAVVVAVGAVAVVTRSGPAPGLGAQAGDSPAATPSPATTVPSPAPSADSVTQPSTATKAARINGWITAGPEGIRDESGQPVRLLGVGDGRMNQCKPLAPNEAEVAALERAGFNSVRLSISWAATEPTAPTREADGTWTHHWDESYLALVEQAISLFRSYDIAVILDMHQVRLSSALGGNACDNVYLPGWLFAGQESRQQAVCDLFTDTAAPQATIRPYEAFSAVWRHYAELYAADSSVIAADVYNEPYVVDECPDVLRENLPRFYGAIGSEIREVNPRIALIFEDVAFEGYQRAGLQLMSLPALDNVIYSWHFYPTTWEEGLPQLAAHVAHAKALGAPLWLGEFHAFGASSNNGRRANANWRADLAAMMAYCRENDVGWSLWEYRGRGSSLLDRKTGELKQPLADDLAAGF